MSTNSNGKRNSEPFNGWRTQAMYSFSEAAHLAGISSSTIRNWLFGYEAGAKRRLPLFATEAEQVSMVSFIQLIEIVVAGRFRKISHVSFQRVHAAYEGARKQYNLEYPFAHLKLESLGGHIIRRIREEQPGTSHQTLDTPALWSMPGLVLDVIHQLDYEQDLAARWFPVGREVPIVIDPRISAGLPTFAGRGVTIDTIYKRWKANQPIKFIAKDFRLDAALVEKALQYAEQVAA